MPTSPLPMSLILSKLCGPTSTSRILIELDLYVLLKASGVEGEGRALRLSEPPGLSFDGLTA